MILKLTEEEKLTSAWPSPCWMRTYEEVLGEIERIKRHVANIRDHAKELKERLDKLRLKDQRSLLEDQEMPKIAIELKTLNLYCAVLDSQQAGMEWAMGKEAHRAMRYGIMERNRREQGDGVKEMREAVDEAVKGGQDG